MNHRTVTQTIRRTLDANCEDVDSDENDCCVHWFIVQNLGLCPSICGCSGGISAKIEAIGAACRKDLEKPVSCPWAVELRGRGGRSEYDFIIASGVREELCETGWKWKWMTCAEG
jgi:hypothetical protein